MMTSWKHCPYYWHFVRRIHPWPLYSPQKSREIRSFDVFFVVRLNKLLYKQSNWRLFQTPWCHCNAVHRLQLVDRPSTQWVSHVEYDLVIMWTWWLPSFASRQMIGTLVPKPLIKQRPHQSVSNAIIKTDDSILVEAQIKYHLYGYLRLLMKL